MPMLQNVLWRGERDEADMVEICVASHPIYVSAKAARRSRTSGREVGLGH